MLSNMRKTGSVLLGVFLALSTSAIAEVQVAEVFSDHMVLQRELPVPVWGTASPGEPVEVTFAGQEVTTTSGTDGKWMVKLKPLETSADGRTMTVTGSNTVTFDDVVVGEVWLCGGQSNMGGTLKEHEQPMIVAKGEKIDLTRYRYFNRNEGWLPINGETYRLLSRVSWYYGIKLYEELNKGGVEVPVGVLTRARSGSTIQSWMTEADAEEIRLELGIAQDWNTDKEHHVPGSMFTEYLDMAIPYAIRGAIWYQGESNANYHAWQYQYLLPHLIERWRLLWSDRAGLPLRPFPFYYVQVPPQSRNSHWSRLRDSMRRVLDTTENTGMAVFYDYGPEVHPPLKEPAGTRLALWALAKDYGFDDIVYSGPLLDKVTVIDDKAVLSFKHVGGGLKSKSGGKTLDFFEIAGKDLEYVPANARIESDTVVVRSDAVPNPVYVRYLFNRLDDEVRSPEVSLVNEDGLPASPFITDDVIPVPVDKKTRRAEESRLRKLDRRRGRNARPTAAARRETDVKVPLTRHTLWLKEPAEFWYEGFPIGNGRLGTMVEGNLNDVFIINEDTLYPAPKNRDMRGAYKYMDDLKRLIHEEKYTEAEALAQDKFLVNDKYPLSNRPLCKLKMLTDKPDATPDSYRRTLEMDKGIATVEYSAGRVDFVRTHFSSYPDQVLVMRFAGGRPRQISCFFQIEGFDEICFRTQGDVLTFSGSTLGDGTAFTGAMRIVAEGGGVTHAEDGIRVDKANAVTLYMTVGTDYYGDDPEKVALARQDSIRGQSYDEILARHVSDFKSLFDRADIHVGPESDPAQMSTAERRESEMNGADDALLASQMFQMGRYIIISSSRPGTLPCHIHGLWMRDHDPTYNCAYIINVNIQLNYQIAEVGNLSALHLPLFDFLDSLRPNGRVTARDVYNCNGFVVHHNVDPTLATGPMFDVQSAFWPMGAAWLCQNLWDHYLFSQDNHWLKNKGYPILKEAAEFVLDYLMENPETGKLIFGPSTSPENIYFTPEGEKARIMTGTAMDQQIAYDLFANCIEAAKVLDLKHRFTDRLKDAMQNLEKPNIGDDGRILEWRRPLREVQPYHRHVSHLYGTYPAALYTQDKDVDIFNAAIESLDARWEEREKTNHAYVPWSTVINMPMYARFKRPADAYKMYKLVFRRMPVKRRTVHKTLVGALNYKKHGIYIDTNGGTAAGIAEMLMQSHRGFIEFLPALPFQWNDGSFRGLRARSGFEIDLVWNKGRWTRAVVKSDAGNELRLLAGKNVTVLEGREPIEFSRDVSGIIAFPTTKGTSYIITNN